MSFAFITGDFALCQLDKWKLSPLSLSPSARPFLDFFNREIGFTFFSLLYLSKLVNEGTLTVLFALASGIINVFFPEQLSSQISCDIPVFAHGFLKGLDKQSSQYSFRHCRHICRSSTPPDPQSMQDMNVDFPRAFPDFISERDATDATDAAAAADDDVADVVDEEEREEEVSTALYVWCPSTGHITIEVIWHLQELHK
tara:strand:+ start:633 stop:1229 length:597 start_codon:yes stop_codon:yes gene_type:complete